MHDYSSDVDRRPITYGIIGIIAYGLAITITAIFDGLGTISSAIAAVTISWGVLFTGLVAVYDHLLWRRKLPCGLRVTRIPDFAGEWTGYIGTTYQGEIPPDALHTSHDPSHACQRLSATLTIEQTWRRIGIHLETKQSDSDSIGATILAGKGKWPNLNYLYENKPNPTPNSGLNAHPGTANLQLRLQDGEEILEGIYYTGPGRENYGTMRFKRRTNRQA